MKYIIDGNVGTAIKLVRTWVLLAGFALISVMVSAQEKGNPGGEINPAVEVDKILLDDNSTHLDDKDTRSPEAEPDSSASDARKRRKALAGLAAIGGIVILGVGVIAGTMLWARRLRRLARDLGPQQKTIGNDFWFLKPPKPVANESEISNSHRPPLGEKRDEM